MPSSLSPSGVAKFFGISTHDRLTFDNHHLILKPTDENTTKMHLKDIARFDVEAGIIWDAFVVVLKTGKRYTVDGLKKDEIDFFAEKVEDEFTNYYYAYHYEQALKIKANFPDKSTYFQRHLFDALTELAKSTMSSFKYLQRNPSNPQHKELLDIVIKLFNTDEALIREHNSDFISAELKQYLSYFDDVEKQPLMHMQRNAVVVNERANLIIAGAGSGKTSVMVARVGYVMQKYGAAAEEILLLAFNKKAAVELQERLRERLGLDNIKVSTFHAMGLNIIANVEGKKASVAPWAASEIAKVQLIRKFIEDLAQQDARFQQILLDFFTYPFTAYKSEFDFKSEIAYRQYIKENRIVSLKGDEVKSYEECEIANFLFLNQVSYLYEAPYKFDTATKEHGQYHPDFYLNGYDIYLEHFGINLKGETAQYIDDIKYLEGMVWKRALHRHNKTKLLETYSHQRQRGCLLKKLKETLAKEGVKLNPMSFEQALEHLNSSGQVDQFSKTIATFINHFKSNDHSIEALQHRAKDDERLLAFLELFRPILAVYEQHKQTLGVIDFEDMISSAIKHVEKGAYPSQYRFILVDEYQDISVSRARLVHALQQQVDNCVLTVVGDDWQSIYRFAGSDISLFHNFERYFGYSASVKLDYTFRYNNKISSVSQRFIEQNPHQIRKEISTITKAAKPSVHIWWNDGDELNRINAIIEGFSLQNKDDHFSVYILGRTRFSFPEGITSIKAQFSDIDITVTTIHSSKGLEADYVILAGLKSGRYGFPSTIEDDPILDLVLAEQEEFEFAEERRLFYVALTRAKKEVHIMASDKNASSFAKEMEEKKHDVNHHYPDNLKPERCPSCESGTLLIRTSENGKSFLGCSNYAKVGCTYSKPINHCPKCHTGIMQVNKEQGTYECNNVACDYSTPACAKCASLMVVRTNKKRGNKFLGCSEYPKCNHTQQL